ncbi:hypothetical protein F4809DRAFT_617041 [Biscogniauxia mediterranea]|nr:hypothetical protein F4809DRAFT_617041 [Biscogniauxia mediterranea]
MAKAKSVMFTVFLLHYCFPLFFHIRIGIWHFISIPFSFLHFPFRDYISHIICTRARVCVEKHFCFIYFAGCCVEDSGVVLC